MLVASLPLSSTEGHDIGGSGGIHSNLSKNTYSLPVLLLPSLLLPPFFLRVNQATSIPRNRQTWAKWGAPRWEILWFGGKNKEIAPFRKIYVVMHSLIEFQKNVRDKKLMLAVAICTWHTKLVPIIVTVVWSFKYWHFTLHNEFWISGFLVVRF